jgi:hypothetical protein
MGGPSAAERVHDTRWRAAKTLLDRATESMEGVRAGPPGSSRDVLPVVESLRPLLPGGGLRRGTVVELAPVPALLFAVLAEASARGHWCALAGLPEVGLVAAAEAGLDLDRLALVPRPGAELAEVAGALLDGIDLVAVAGTERLPPAARRRLAARARQRGAVLCALGRWPGAELEIGVHGSDWQGLAGAGAGRLRCRRVRLRAGGRGSAHRGRSAEVLLPGPSGAVEPVPAELLRTARPVDPMPVGEAG